MRGIGADDGRMVFVSILQKFAAKLNTEAHALLWADVDGQRVCACKAPNCNGKHECA